MNDEEMNKRLYVPIIISVTILILCIVTAILTRPIWVCFGQNETICRLKRTIISLPFENMKGTFQQVIRDKEITTVEWSQDKEDQEILIKDSKGKETMHLIEGKSDIYLKDYIDNKWWKQVRSKKNSTDVTLSFKPREFFLQLAEAVRDTQNSFVLKGQEACGTSVCLVYYSSKKNNGTPQFYLDTQKKNLKKIIITTALEKKEITIRLVSENVSIPIRDIKNADTSRNLFIELQFANPSSRSQPEYLQQFEQERQAIEAFPGVSISTTPPRYK